MYLLNSRKLALESNRPTLADCISLIHQILRLQKPIYRSLQLILIWYYLAGEKLAGEKGTPGLLLGPVNLFKGPAFSGVSCLLLAVVPYN